MFYRNMISYRRNGNFVTATRIQSAHKFGGETIYGSLNRTPISALFAGHCDWIRRDIDERKRIADERYNSRKAA